MINKLITKLKQAGVKLQRQRTDNTNIFSALVGNALVGNGILSLCFVNSAKKQCIIKFEGKDDFLVLKVLTGAESEQLFEQCVMSSVEANQQLEIKEALTQFIEACKD